MNRNSGNIIISIVILIVCVAVLHLIVQMSRGEDSMTGFEKDLIFTKKYGTNVKVPEEKQLIWERLVSDNVQKSGYDVREDTLLLDIKTVFYTNTDHVPIPVDYIKKSYNIQQNLLNRLGVKIKFVVRPIQVVMGSPDSPPDYIKTDYYSYDIDYFSLKVMDDKALTVVIYNDAKTDNVGMSYGIPSNLIKLELKGLDPAYSTVAHEIFHALGLYHTHKLDTSGETYSYEGGDMIGDTPISCPLYEIVDQDCIVKKEHKAIRNILKEREMYKTNEDNLDELNEEEIEILTKNIMSYTFKPCRDTLTNEQVNKVLFTIQTNKDIRNMFLNFSRKDYLKEVSSRVKNLQ